MNEPDAALALVVLGVVLATPILLTLLITLSARRARRTLWLVWAIGFLAFVAIAGPLAAKYSVNSEDAITFTGLIVGTGIATASAAWVVERKLRADPTLGLWQLARYSVLTSVGVMIVAMFISC